MTDPESIALHTIDALPDAQPIGAVRFWARDTDLARAVGEWTESAFPDGDVRERCYDIIERFWNAPFQRRCIERAVDGLPGDDLWWMKKPGAGAVSCVEEH